VTHDCCVPPRRRVDGGTHGEARAGERSIRGRNEGRSAFEEHDVEFDEGEPFEAPVVAAFERRICEAECEERAAEVATVEAAGKVFGPTQCGSGEAFCAAEHGTVEAFGSAEPRDGEGRIAFECLAREAGVTSE
jgi:hypothetical protein